MSQKLTTWITLFNAHYPAFLRFLVGMSEVLYTTSQTIIVSFGVPVVLGLLLVVEHERVKHGIALFESSPSLASFAAWSMVILNLVLEFTVHHVEAKAGYKQVAAQQASLRLKLAALAYWLGISRRWQPIALSPAYRYKKLLKLVTFTILALALAGSMRTTINVQTGAWYTALANVATQSTLAEMSTWLGGLLFALAAVVGAQGLTAYLAVRVAEITEQMNEVRALPVTLEAAHQEGDTEPIYPVEAVLEVQPSVEAYADYEIPLPPFEGWHSEKPGWLPPNEAWQSESKPSLPTLAICPHCEWIKEYDSPKQAAQGLNGHLRYCQKAKQPASNGH